LNKDRVCLGHRGVWWAEIETFGRQAHGSMPFLGDCAVRHMGSVLTKFENELYPRLAQKRTEMPVVPDGARQSTMNINSIHGGEGEAGTDGKPDDYSGLPSPNVPDSCRMIIDRRFLIEEDIATVKREVVDLLEGLKSNRADFDYAVKDIMEVLPIMTERDAPVVQAVTEGIQSVFGRDPDYIISPGTYDQKHIARIGHLHDCIAYGPGILDLAHQPDEFIIIDDMIESAKVMAHAIHVLLNA
jgi:succinyl-diaminopimelate desuccinylase